MSLKSSAVLLVIFVSSLSGCGVLSSNPTKNEAKRAYALMQYNSYTFMYKYGPSSPDHIVQLFAQFYSRVASHKDKFISAEIASLHKIKCMKVKKGLYSCVAEERVCSYHKYADNFCLPATIKMVNGKIMFQDADGKMTNDEFGKINFNVRYEDGKWVAHS